MLRTDAVSDGLGLATGTTQYCLGPSLVNDARQGRRQLSEVVCSSLQHEWCLDLTAGSKELVRFAESVGERMLRGNEGAASATAARARGTRGRAHLCRCSGVGPGEPGLDGLQLASCCGLGRWIGDLVAIA